MIMKLIELFEGSDDEKHQEALDKTGFWGNRGAGCIFFAKSSRKFMLAHRSEDVEQPGDFGSFGGAIDSNEDPITALKREIKEETGFNGPCEIKELYVFKSANFRYYNYVVIVENEFKPTLDWENQGYVWCTLDDLPHPLHFGIKSILNDTHAMDILRSLENDNINESIVQNVVLYHGTLLRKLSEIKQHGLSGEFTKVMPGNIHFASDRYQAAEYFNNMGEGDGLLLSVNSNELNLKNLGPDRDDLSDMIPARKDWRDYSWKQSLKICGQCTYKGTIEPSKITVEGYQLNGGYHKIKMPLKDFDPSHL